MRLNRFAWVVAMSLCAVTQAGTAAPKKSPFEIHFPAASPLAKWVGSQADAALDYAAIGPAESETWNASKSKVNTALGLAIAYGTAKDIDAFREADFARRLLLQLEPLEDEDRRDLLKYFQAHDEIARLFAYSVRTGVDVRGVFQLFDRLRQERPNQVDQFPNLAVALCLVRDRTLLEHINENTVQAAEPVDVFDFYANHEGQMLYGIRDMPVDLLVYVVDTTASIDEMNWAVRKYAGTNDVGHLYFTITYDYAYLGGARKKLDVAGFSLQNILKVGGVCVDQAYFSTTVGKAIGVPTAMTGAASADMGHAWIGYLQVKGRQAAWNFDSGRYDAYQVIRGNVTDPQTRRGTADSTVSMLGDMIGTTLIQRQNAVAMVDSARILMGPKAIPDAEIEDRSHRSHTDDDGSIIENDFTAPEVPTDFPASIKAKLPAPRAATGEAGLELVEMGLRQYASYAPGWELVAALASHDDLTDAQKETWAGLVQKLCGTRHPDFTLSVLEPMILTVKTPDIQSKLWDTFFTLMVKRPDLAAEIRLHQGKMWLDRGDLPKAEMCYEDVIKRFINAGPFALRAVSGDERVLEKMGQPDKVLDMYARAFSLVNKPNLKISAEFVKQSNWYNLREAYAKKLEQAGQPDRAAAIRSDKLLERTADAQ